MDRCSSYSDLPDSSGRLGVVDAIISVRILEMTISTERLKLGGWGSGG